MVKTIENIKLSFGEDHAEYIGNIVVDTNQHSIEFIDSETGEPIADICKIVPSLQPNEFAIKTILKTKVFTLS